MKWCAFVIYFQTIAFVIASMILSASFLLSKHQSQIIPLWDCSKIVLNLSQSASQLIIMYLIFKLSNNKVTINIKEARDNESEDDYENSLDSDMQFLIYFQKDLRPKLEM